MDNSKALLEKTRRAARKHYNRIEGETRQHYSHSASEALEKAARDTGLEHFGVEGSMEPDMLYLNMGDTYAATVLFCGRTRRFTVQSWGDCYEREERNG